MKRKIKICVLMIMLFMALAVGSYSTYAFLTDSEDFTLDYTIGQINGTVTVTGDAVDEVGIVTNSDLAYIHYQDDMIGNKGLLDEMASEIKVSIKFKNSFPTRVKVQVPTVDENDLQYGLIYIVIDDTSLTKDKKVILNVDDDGNLQYAYEGETTWTTVVTGLTESLEHDLLRSKINEYNTGKLVGLYEDNLFSAESDVEFNFRILVWGDYYDLSDDDKAKYLEMSYNFAVTAKVIQAKDQYNGGGPDYEND